MQFKKLQKFGAHKEKGWTHSLKKTITETPQTLGVSMFNVKDSLLKSWQTWVKKLRPPIWKKLAGTISTTSKTVQE